MEGPRFSRKDASAAEGGGGEGEGEGRGREPRTLWVRGCPQPWRRRAPGRGASLPRAHLQVLCCALPAVYRQLRTIPCSCSPWGKGCGNSANSRIFLAPRPRWGGGRGLFALLSPLSQLSKGRPPSEGLFAPLGPALTRFCSKCWGLKRCAALIRALLWEEVERAHSMKHTARGSAPGRELCWI